MDPSESDRRSDRSPKPVSKTLSGSSSGGRNDYPPSKKAQTEGRTILYVDESACYLLPFVAHSWAPRGQTPLLVEQAGRAHLNLIAAISPTGRSYLAGQDQPFDSEDIGWFLGKLCWHYRRQNLLVICQGRLCGWGGYSPFANGQKLASPPTWPSSSRAFTSLQSYAQSGRVRVEPP